MKRFLRVSAVLALLAPQLVLAEGACEGFKWKVPTERALFAGDAVKLIAGMTTESAPAIKPSRLYEVALSPQEDVKYAAPASKKMLADGASGGMVRFRIADAGSYRVSLNAGFWIDIAAAGKTVPSLDFSGSPDCAAPRKIVVYELPANQDLFLQFSGATPEQVRVTLTPVVSAVP